MSSLNNPTIVESYVNGTNWYRIWNDGWVEQGGTIPISSLSQGIPINFLIPFSNTDYNVEITTQAGDSENTTSRIYIVNRTITQTGITVANNGWGTNYFGIKGFWVARGKRS